MNSAWRKCLTVLIENNHLIWAFFRFSGRSIIASWNFQQLPGHYSIRRLFLFKQKWARARVAHWKIENSHFFAIQFLYWRTTFVQFDFERFKKFEKSQNFWKVRPPQNYWHCVCLKASQCKVEHSDRKTGSICTKPFYWTLIKSIFEKKENNSLINCARVPHLFAPQVSYCSL